MPGKSKDSQKTLISRKIAFVLVHFVQQAIHFSKIHVLRVDDRLQHALGLGAVETLSLQSSYCLALGVDVEVTLFGAAPGLSKEI